MKNRIFYGDIHGCYNELVQLYHLMKATYPDAEHWHLGDLVDRGPDSGLCVQFVMDNFDGGIFGNHEETILKQWETYKRRGYLSKNPDKANTVKQLNEERVAYISNLPRLHVFDDVNLVIVHGGIYPRVPLYKQSAMPNTCRLQMTYLRGLPSSDYYHGIKTDASRNRWWGADASRQPETGRTEEENIKEGYERWYKAYDHEYDCIYGHSVMGLHPFIHQNEGYGKTIGLDTGSCFGGYLTAMAYPSMEYVRIECPDYVKGKNVSQMKIEERR